MHRGGCATLPGRVGGANNNTVCLLPAGAVAPPCASAGFSEEQLTQLADSLRPHIIPTPRPYYLVSVVRGSDSNRVCSGDRHSSRAAPSAPSLLRPCSS